MCSCHNSSEDNIFNCSELFNGHRLSKNIFCFHMLNIIISCMLSELFFYEIRHIGEGSCVIITMVFSVPQFKDAMTTSYT